MIDGFDRNLLFGEYRAEARQQLDTLDATLVALEETGSLGDHERRELLRVLHTLKGNSAMLGLQQVAEQVHAVEGWFKPDAGGTVAIPLEAMFELSATIRSALGRLGSPDQGAALERVGAVRIPTPGSAGSPSDPADSGSEQAVPDAAAAPAHSGGATVPANSSESASSVVPSARGEASAGGAAASHAGGTRTGPARGDGSPASRHPGAAPATEDEVIRVPFGKLDALLTRVGDLVGIQTRLERVLEANLRAVADPSLLRELREHVEDLEVLARALRDATMDLRLVPLQVVLGRFPAMVRELARSQGKRARTSIVGEGIELDKSAVDALAEPLLHLVRNAVDHGLEPAEERAATGKDPVGTIGIEARREGDQIALEVWDDGSGLDRAAIHRSALAAGLVEAGGAPETDLDDLIFAPGFSTRQEATTVSGRGMGLDIVRRTVTRLRGSLEHRARPGGGSVFVLRLPLTLTILPALLFERRGELLAVPAGDVRETVARPPVERIGGTDVLRDGSDLVPLAEPARIFEWREGEDLSNRPARYLIVLRKGERSAAIPADRLIDQRDIVVKAMPAHLHATPGISGVSVTAEGRVMLLLDSQAVVDLNLVHQRRATRAE
jgi:two-component system, chemotaxis family, sensor kinase CheA